MCQLYEERKKSDKVVTVFNNLRKKKINDVITSIKFNNV